MPTFFLCRQPRSNPPFVFKQGTFMPDLAIYDSLFQNNHSVMLIIAPDSGKILDANTRACLFYGYTWEQLTLLTIMDIHRTFSEKELKAEMLLAKQEQRNHFLFQHRLATGEIREVEVYSGPIILHGEKVLYSIIYDITERKKQEKEREELITKLEKALKEIKQLQGIIPICASCKQIRDDKGAWNQMEQYISKHSDAQFSHGICPECMEKLYPELGKGKK